MGVGESVGPYVPAAFLLRSKMQQHPCKVIHHFRLGYGQDYDVNRHRPHISWQP